ncbi:homeobox protein 2 [Musca vetustissima]|uniref:homeobox protein 2 n=1 Tax=Musca vetustissima TaxID=27455 RepID=UPI002AB7BFDC|nr:homeobox protein 2 [Musca vetustissima]
MYWVLLTVTVLLSAITIPTGSELLDLSNSNSNCQCRDCECSKRQKKAEIDFDFSGDVTRNALLRKRRKNIEELLRNFHINLENEKKAAQEIRDVNAAKGHDKGVSRNFSRSTENGKYLEENTEKKSARPKGSPKANVSKQKDNKSGTQHKIKPRERATINTKKIPDHNTNHNNVSNKGKGGKSTYGKELDLRYHNNDKLSDKYPHHFTRSNIKSKEKQKVNSKERKQENIKSNPQKLGDQLHASPGPEIANYKNDRETQDENVYESSDYEDYNYDIQDLEHCKDMEPLYQNACYNELQTAKHTSKAIDNSISNNFKNPPKENFPKPSDTKLSNELSEDYPLEEVPLQELPLKEESLSELLSPEVPLKDVTYSNLHSSHNNELQLKKNNLSDEANYKLSKIEQESAETNNNNSNSFWRWPWSAEKRSSDFNAMDEIKLKTSNRLMAKGYGPSLPSYSLGENLRELRIDNLLKSQEEGILKNGMNCQEEGVNDDNLNDFKIEEDAVDWNPGNVVEKWNHIRRKRSIDESEEQELSTLRNEENYQQKHHITKRDGFYYKENPDQNFENINYEDLEEAQNGLARISNTKNNPNRRFKTKESPQYNKYVRRSPGYRSINNKTEKAPRKIKGEGNSKDFGGNRKYKSHEPYYKDLKGNRKYNSLMKPDEGMSTKETYENLNRKDSLRRIRLHHGHQRKNSRPRPGTRKPFSQSRETLVNNPLTSVMNPHDVNLKDNVWPTHLYDHNPNLRAWLDALTKDNITDLKTTDDPDKLELHLHNDLLNCTTYAGLDEFLKSLPKNTTESTPNSNDMEEIDMDFTTVEIDEFPTENPNSENVTDLYTDTYEENTTEDLEEPEDYFTESEMENTTACVEVTTRNWLDFENTTEDGADYEIPENNTDDYEWSAITQDPDLNNSAIENPDVKWNININAQVHGNAKNKSYMGNGTILLNSGFGEDDRYRRHTPKKIDSSRGNWRNNLANEEQHERPSDDDSSDITSGKLSANIVQKIFRTVREHPKLKILWPSLQRNKLAQRPEMPNFYTIRNKDSEQQLQQSEQLMKQALNTLNDLIDQQVYSRSCLPLRPDLQKFYEQILKTQDERNKYRKKRENDKKIVKRQSSKNKISQGSSYENSNEKSDENRKDSPGNKAEKKSSIGVRNLLRLYEGDDVRSASDQLEALREMQEREAKERRKHIQEKYRKDGSNDALKILEQYYSPEYSKLQKACESYRELG